MERTNRSKGLSIVGKNVSMDLEQLPREPISIRNKKNLNTITSVYSFQVILVAEAKEVGMLFFT